MRRAGAPLGLVFASLLWSACATKPIIVDFTPPAHAYRGEDYGDVYERWTRHDKVVKNVETVLEIWATYKSADFREGFVARYAELYSVADAEREKLRRSQGELAATGYEFFITTQSANYRWNDLEKKNSAWRVTLVDGAGHEISPDALKVEKLPDLFEQEFYPAKTPFTKTYSVRFARPAARDDEFVGERSGVLILRFASPFGSADLVWRDQEGQRRQQDRHG